MYNLSRWFYENNQGFSSLPESEFRYEDSQRGNIIYVGQYKTMGVSKELFLRNSKVFKANYKYFEYTEEGLTKQYKAKFKAGLRSEYAMVSYMPLPNGKKALYFVSNHDIGTMASLNNFIDLEYLEQFYKKMPSSKAYFNALFKVEGVDRSNISCELVALEIVE